LGKALWTKGYRNLLDLLAPAPAAAGRDAAEPPRAEGGWRMRTKVFWLPPGGEGVAEAAAIRVDCFGSGPDAADIRAAAVARGLAADGPAAEDPPTDPWMLRFFPGVDHADESLRAYTTFVNPSTSDVLCTATAEALAMGKRVVLARHPSNQFFEENFPSRVFPFEPRDTDSFLTAVREAESLGPLRPLEERQRRLLTWEAANERLFDAAAVRVVLKGRRWLPRVRRRPSREPEGRASDAAPAPGEVDGLRPSNVAQARLGYHIHHLLGKGAFGDFLRTVGRTGPEVRWRDRRIIGAFLEGRDYLREARLSISVEDLGQDAKELWASWRSASRERRACRAHRYREWWQRWESRWDSLWRRATGSPGELAGADEGGAGGGADGEKRARAARRRQEDTSLFERVRLLLQQRNLVTGTQTLQDATA